MQLYGEGELPEVELVLQSQAHLAQVVIHFHPQGGVLDRTRPG